MSKRTVYDLLSPGTKEELDAIRKELLALDGMYQLAPNALESATQMLWIDRRTRSTSAQTPEKP